MALAMAQAGGSVVAGRCETVHDLPQQKLTMHIRVCFPFLNKTSGFICGDSTLFQCSHVPKDQPGLDLPRHVVHIHIVLSHEG